MHASVHPSNKNCPMSAISDVKSTASYEMKVLDSLSRHTETKHLQWVLTSQLRCFWYILLRWLSCLSYGCVLLPGRASWHGVAQQYIDRQTQRRVSERHTHLQPRLVWTSVQTGDGRDRRVCGGARVACALVLMLTWCDGVRISLVILCRSMMSSSSLVSLVQEVWV